MKKIHKNKKVFICSSIFALIAPLVLSLCVFTAARATNYCQSDKCKAAQQALDDATQKAAEAKNTATSLEAEVAALKNEIAVLEAEIAANQAVADELKAKINENEVKLNKQRAALAKMLADEYYTTEKDAIHILASSENIGDLAEQQTQAEILRQQISDTASNLKSIKAQLEAEKAQVDAIIVAQNNSRAAIAAKKAESERLVQKYKNDAASYAADAEAARKIKEEEIAKYIAEMNSRIGGTVIVDPGLNSYPYANRCPRLNWRYTGDDHSGAYGGLYCECTSYAGYKARERWGTVISAWGDAKNWGNSAAARGFRVDNTPETHSIGYYVSGAWGHVVWIESVNANGTINYSEYNGNVIAGFSYVTNASASRFRYIHLH